MAERSYLASEATDGGQEELSRVQGQGRHPKPEVAARRSNPMPEASGGGSEEQPHIQSGGCLGEGGPRGAIEH